MAWLQILLLTVVGNLICRCTAKKQVCFISDSNHTPYDTDNEICCNNTIQARVRYQDCCGGRTIYFQDRQVCCNGEIMDRFIPPKGGKVVRDCSINKTLCQEQTCCADELVDKDNTRCCQNKIIDLTHIPPEAKSSIICCGSNIINRHMHLCCQNKEHVRQNHLDCCGENVYDTRAETCLDNLNPHKVVGKYVQACGNTEYNTRTHSCCSGILYNIPERDPKNWTRLNQHKECCDHYAYDRTKEQCCRASHNDGFKTHTIPLKENIYCCGDSLYNSTHQDCYKGKVIEHVYGKKRCGYHFIDGSREGCCADVSYNTNYHYCCEGQEFNVISKHENCCNGIGINSSKLCCEGRKPCEKKNPADNECCFNYKTDTGKTYNSENNDFCVDGEVVRLPPGADSCGRSPYYPNSQICCEGTIENISLGYDQCCGDKPYKSKSQQCCYDEVSNISPTEGSCCDIDYQVYRVNDTRNPCRKPCGNTFYDLAFEMCCENKVHAFSPSGCCGSSPFNSETTECCGGRFLLAKTGKMKCCENKDLYDDSISRCNKKLKKVIPRNKNRRHQTDAQRLCSPMALKHFDGGIKYACESQYAVRARIAEVRMTRKRGSTIYMNVLLSDVRNVNRGANFTAFLRQKNITANIEVANSHGVVCKKRFLDRFCEVIIFFNDEVKKGKVKISNSSKFFMVSYTTQWEKIITKQLSYQFCQEQFGKP